MKKKIIIFLFLLNSYLNLNAETLDLYDCIKACLENSPTTKKHRHFIQEYEYKIQNVLSSFYPRIVLFGDYYHEYYEKNDNYSVGVNLNQLLFNGFKRMNNYKIAKTQKSIIINNYNNTVKDLIYQIKENYFIISMNKKQIKMLNLIIKRRKKDLTIIKLHYAIGKENSVSVMEMEADLNISKHEKLKRIDALNFSKKRLAILMGEKHDFEFEIEDSEDSLPEYDYNKILQEGKNNSHELNINKLQLQIEKYRLSSTKGEYYFPEINLTSSYGYIDNKFFPKEKNWRIGMSISFPIFTGFSTPNTINEINSRIKSTEEERKEIIHNIEINLNDLLNKYNLLKKEQEISLLKYKSTLAHYRLLKLEYKQGKVSYLWLKEKENELTTLELEKEEIIYNIKITLAELERMIGRLL